MAGSMLPPAAVWLAAASVSQTIWMDTDGFDMLCCVARVVV